MKPYSLSVYQIVICFIAIVFILDRLQRFMKREMRQSLLKLFASLFIWLSILVFSAFPLFAGRITDMLGINDNTTVILTGFTVVFMLIYKLLSVIEQLDKNITKLVRNEALRDLKKNSKK